MSGYIPPPLIYLHFEHRNNCNMRQPDKHRCETFVILQCRWKRTLNPVRSRYKSFTMRTLRPSGGRGHTIYLSLMKKKTLLFPSYAFNCKLSILNTNGMKIVTSPGLDMKSRICIDQCVTQERDSGYWQACQLHGNVGSLHSREFKMFLLDARSHDNLFTIKWLATCWPTGVRLTSGVEIFSVTRVQASTELQQAVSPILTGTSTRAAGAESWPLTSVSSRSYECVDSPFVYLHISLWRSFKHENAVSFNIMPCTPLVCSYNRVMYKAFATSP